MQAGNRQQMRSAGFAQRAPGRRAHRAGDADGETAHHARRIVLAKVSVEPDGDGLAQALHRRRQCRCRQPARRAGAHIAGGVDALAGKPALVVESGRIAETARRLQAHRQLPALAGAQRRTLAIPGQLHPPWAGQGLAGHSQRLDIHAQAGPQRIGLRQLTDDSDQQRIRALEGDRQAAGKRLLYREHAVCSTAQQCRQHQHRRPPPADKRGRQRSAGQHQRPRGRRRAGSEQRRGKPDGKADAQTDEADWHAESAPSPAPASRCPATDTAMSARVSARASPGPGRHHNHFMQPSSKRCASSV